MPKCAAFGACTWSVSCACAAVADTRRAAAADAARRGAFVLNIPCSLRPAAIVSSRAGRRAIRRSGRESRCAATPDAGIREFRERRRGMARAAPSPGSGSPAPLLPPDELQPRPRLVDGADLHVDQPGRQRDLPDRVLVEVA